MKIDGYFGIIEVGSVVCSGRLRRKSGSVSPGADVIARISDNTKTVAYPRNR